jgi:hypothetical protein
MRWPLHVVAGSAYVIAVYFLSPAARVGAISYLSAMVYGAMATIVVYALAVLGLGLFSGWPISKWPQLIRQLFGGTRKHDD